MLDKIKEWFGTAVEFLKGLWDKLLVWLDPYIAYLKANPILAYALIGTAALLLLVLIISGCVRAKRRKARKRLAKQQAQAKAQETVAPAPVEEVAPVEAVVEEPVEEVAPVEAVVEEPVEEVAPVEAVVEEPVEEVVVDENAEEIAKAKAEAEQRKAAEQAEIERVLAEKTAKEEAQKAKKQKKEPVPVKLYDELKDVEEEHEIWYDENETDKAARYSGKWLICRVLTEDGSTDEMYFFELHASNGEKLLSSEEYTSYQGAVRGIETHKANILKGNFRITLSKKGDYIFKLLSGKNMLLCMGENYPTKARCESAIESAKRFAKTAILDENVQDHIIKVPVEDETEVLPLPDGYNGKWIISSRQDGDETTYWFELFANNGEKLLASEEYTSYIGAVNGIQTHKTNIAKGNFRISLTKRGDYIYKLLNGNGQLLCLGEHYKTKHRCQNAVESVKRFAMNSPVLTSADTTK